MHDLSELRTFYKNYSGCLTYRDLGVSLYKLSNSPGPVSRRLPQLSPMCKCSFSKLFIFPEPEIHSGAPDVTPPPLCPASSPSPYIPLRVSVCASERNLYARALGCTHSISIIKTKDLRALYLRWKHGALLLLLCFL